LTYCQQTTFTYIITLEAFLKPHNKNAEGKEGASVIMQSKQRYLYILILVIVLTGIGAGGWAWSKYLSQHNTSQQVGKTTSGSQKSQPAAAHTRSIPGIPVDTNYETHLVIPAIGVNAPVEYVHQDTDGRLGVPTVDQWVNVGWYDQGPKPGGTGSAVIDGHLDRTGGSPAVFWNLKKLHVGDLVMVKNKSGQQVNFQVTKMQNYAPNAAPLAQIFGRNDGEYLNLITCAGVWLPAQNQTSQRLVVYTKRIE
jgi:LPXTG-site transpeptidase (sortase) family protein